ncbi:peptidoglycan DD-metalloendopeptidase family protein [Paradesulfitobacterium ferrireducens]|uniref:peptidoglycan DD-metalloendopeptidase family protein n=1 Tax=Paradesulfitobacterium ferrireducens TaxID=2816476 RepID=UPI001A8CB56E|nr:peptidoglycan DD-metalloendopeptidase family protein [Paradesulfitobacterium ferrireducens]
MRKFTILIIPEGHARARQFRFSVRGKRLLLGASVGFTLLVSLLLAHDLYQNHYIKAHEQKFAQIDYLQKALQAKDQEIARLTEQNIQITQNLGQINSLEQEISSILRIEPTKQNSERNSGMAPQSYVPSRSTDLNADLLQAQLERFQKYRSAALTRQDQLLHTPSTLPLEGEIASDFGYRKNPFGRWTSEFHSGIDIACDYGTEVHATASGTVVFAGWDNIYGRKVTIDHGNGIVTFYGHNARLLVKVGQEVNQGDVIALSGNSGRSTGAHLHYGVIVNGENRDPLNFMDTPKEQ